MERGAAAPDARPAAGSDGPWSSGNRAPTASGSSGGWRDGGGVDGAWGGAMRRSPPTPASTAPGLAGRQAAWGVLRLLALDRGWPDHADDLQHGRINHALALRHPQRARLLVRAPAQANRRDLSSPLRSRGAHLRLDPSLDLSALGLPRLTLMIAEAAQRYGIMIRDNRQGAHLFAEDPRPTGAEPLCRRGGYFEGRTRGSCCPSFPGTGFSC